MLQPPDHRDGALLHSLQFVNVCLVLESPKLDTVLHLLSQKSTPSAFWLNSLPTQPGMLLAFSTARTHCWLMSTRTWSLIFRKQLPIQSASNLYCCMGLFHSRYRSADLFFLNFMKCLPAYLVFLNGNTSTAPPMSCPLWTCYVCIQSHLPDCKWRHKTPASWQKTQSVDHYFLSIVFHRPCGWSSNPIHISSVSKDLLGNHVERFAKGKTD